MYSTKQVGDSAEKSACVTGHSIRFWILNFLGLCVFGMGIYGAGSLGNGDSDVRWYKPFIAILFLFIWLVRPFAWGAIDSFDNFQYNNTYIFLVALIMVILVILFQLRNMVFMLFPRGSSTKTRIHRQTMQDEMDHKSAFAYKIDRLVNNALDIHAKGDSQNIFKTYYGHALDAFFKSNETVLSGGLSWSWKKIWNKDVARKEGIWCEYEPPTKLVSYCADRISLFSVFILLSIFFSFGALTVSKSFAVSCGRTYYLLGR